MKTLYEVHWHYKDGGQTVFSHCSVSPITVLREGVLPGCTGVSITAKDSKGDTFLGTPKDYFESEAAAWADARQSLLGTIENNDRAIARLKEETFRLHRFLVSLPDAEGKEK